MVNGIKLMYDSGKKFKEGNINLMYNSGKKCKKGNIDLVSMYDMCSDYISQKEQTQSHIAEQI